MTEFTGNVRKVVGASLVSAVCFMGCSRDHIEAINLANQGDQAVKSNVSRATKLYEEATALDPSNHRIFRKLAQAYQKQEEWAKMASTLSRAAQIAPDFADYYQKRGQALLKIAEAGNPDAYEEAKQPLKTCIEKDPNFAECYNLLGTAHLWTGDEQGALQNYSEAIEKDASVGVFYTDLAQTYTSLKMYDEAEKVLTEGAKLLRPTVGNANALYGIYTILFQVHQAKGDTASCVADLEKANRIGGKDHPEIAFNLGSTYATMNPPKKEKALRLLKAFNKKTCRSKVGQEKFKDQCATSTDLVQKLSSL